jgi:hypothetical protein
VKPAGEPMQFRIHPHEVQLVVAALGALAGLLALGMRRSGRGLDAALGFLAALGGLGFFVLSASPLQFVKTWDVQHAYFGAKYARELGYFRIYECMLELDAGAAGVFRGIDAASDLRRPMASLPRSALLRDSACERRFDPERRRAFLADLAFFQRLPDQPDRALWFADNGYNQTPFFTALVAPFFLHLPLRYATLLGLALVDPLLIAISLAAVFASFGLRTGLVASLFFFTEVPNQWNVMGGAILRFGYLSAAMLGACAFARGRAKTAGVAFGIATLLQIFPALLPAGLVAWALLRRARGEGLPEWLPGLVVAFFATVAAGVVASAALVGLGAWPEFFEKILLHGQMLSLYRIGLKSLVTLDHFLVPAPDYDYAAALQSLAARSALHAAGAALLGVALVSLVRRVGALLFATTALAVALTILTPVHYYFAVLVLLLLVGPEQARAPAATLSWTALLAWSAAGYAALLATDSRAFVNSAILGAGLFVVLIVHCLGWRGAARRATPRCQEDS